jgi:hypothetical protein
MKSRRTCHVEGCLGSKAGQVELRMVYVLRDERCRSTFMDLMSEQASVAAALMTLAGADGHSYALNEQPGRRRGKFVEVLGFASERERDRFDDLYCQDRKIAAIQGLIDELVDAAHSDYVVTRGAPERRSVSVGWA